MVSHRIPGIRIAKSLSKQSSSWIIAATLALAIGGATAIFTFVHGVLLRPLDFPQPDRLVMLCETSPTGDDSWCSASPANGRDFGEHSASIESVVLARTWRTTWRRPASSEPVGLASGVATAGMVEVFGIAPLVGRAIEPGDLQPGAEPVVLLQEGFWRREMGADRDAVGSATMVLDGIAHRVIGVLPERLTIPYLEDVDAWIALDSEHAESRDWRGFLPFARLAPGIDFAPAQAELDLLMDDLASTDPAANAGWSVSVESLHGRIVRSVRPALLALLVTAGAVVLVASFNIANLLMARATIRDREFALRTALGAGRLRLARQLGLEGLWLGTAGAIGGSLLAVWLVDFFLVLAPGDFPRLDQIEVHGGALAAGWAVALSLGPMLSLLPLRHLTRSRHLAQRGGRTQVEAAYRMRSTLVVAQLALTLVLLVGAGLLVRSYSQQLQWQPGFDVEGLTVFSLFPSVEAYPDPASLHGLYGRAREELEALPGIASVGTGSAGPLYGGDGDQEYFVEGRPVPPDGARATAYWYDVGPGYFDSFGLEPLRGRVLAEEPPNGPKVAVINQTLARQAFAGRDPIGAAIHMVLHDETFEIVGVVRDIPPFSPGEPTRPKIYWSDRQLPRWATQFVIRTDGAPNDLRPMVAARLAALDPSLEPGAFFSFADRIESRLVVPRFHTTLVTGFTLLALLIATVGVYGSAAFQVGQRTREFGIRLALGARPDQLIRNAMGRMTRLAVLAVVLGLMTTATFAPALRSLVVAIDPLDPLLLAGTAILLLAVALTAAYLPARRTVALDPNNVLRTP